MYTFNIDIGRIIGEKQNWAVVCVATIKNFTASETIIPCLTVAIQRTITIDAYVLAAPNPEGDGFLKGIVEIVRLPVCDVVGKLVTSAFV
jgi:hypothetical protein